MLTVVDMEELFKALRGPTRPAPRRMPRPNLSNVRVCRIAPRDEHSANVELARGFHWHKCGFVLDRNENEPDPSIRGCGFGWAHENDGNELINPKREPSHDCPRCKTGSWLTKFFAGKS